MALKCKSSDADHSDMPIEIIKCFLWVKRCESLINKKKSYAEAAKIYGKNEASVCEIVKEKKLIHTSFAVLTSDWKVTATVCDKCLVKMQKALYLWVILKDRNHIHVTFY